MKVWIVLEDDSIGDFRQVWGVYSSEDEAFDVTDNQNLGRNNLYVRGPFELKVENGCG